MSARLTIGVEAAVPLGTTVSVITAQDAAGRVVPIKTVTVYETDVDMYLVTGSPVEGGALPGTGRPKVLSTDRWATYEVGGGGLGVVAGGAGTARMEVR